MLKNHNKLFVIIYSIIVVLISLFAGLYRLKFWSFFASFIFALLCFVGIYFCIKGLSKNKLWLRILKGIGILIFLALIGATWIYSSFSGFHSSYCYNLVGKNIITGSIDVYCNFPPWYTEIIGGEDARKILLDDCKNRKSPFYDQNPDYCNVYEEDNSDKDWSIGPNP